MILKGVVEKAGLTTFKIASGARAVPVTTGNTVMFFSLREAAKRGIVVRLEGVMETVLFKECFVPARFLEAGA